MAIRPRTSRTLHVPEVQKVDEYPVFGQLLSLATVHVDHAHVALAISCRHAHESAVMSQGQVGPADKTPRNSLRQSWRGPY